MKINRINILSSINLLLASAIAALGFAGCSHQKNAAKQKEKAEDDSQTPKVEEISASDDQQMVCMYGVPRAEYIVHGSVLDQKGYPLRKHSIIIKSHYNEISLETDENGNFDVNFDGFPAEELTFEIDGKEYVEPVTYDSEPVDAWNRGTATMKVKIVHQKPLHQDPPIMLKYGVPPTRVVK
jgi:putative lipoprotein (rSAM/lipoprotein system)